MPFGLHPFMLLILLGVGLLFFAPKKLPQITAGIGKSIKGFKHEIQSSKKEEIDAPKREEPVS